MKRISLFVLITRIMLIALLITHTAVNNSTIQHYIRPGAVLCFIVYIIATIAKQVTIPGKEETQNSFFQYGNILEFLGFLILVVLLLTEA